MTDQEWITETLNAIMHSFRTNQNVKILYDESLIAATVYAIYAYHKHYLMEDGSLENIAQIDSMSRRLQERTVEINTSRPEYLRQQYKILDAAAKSSPGIFDRCYRDLLMELIPTLSMYSDPNFYWGILSMEINLLIASFINRSKCKSVYIPYSGVAAITQILNRKCFTCRVLGTENVETSALFGGIIQDAYGGDISDITCAHPWNDWNTSHVDAVIINIPDRIVNTETHSFMSIEQLEKEILFRATELNQAKLVIVLVPEFIDSLPCLLDENQLQLDTMIEMPLGVLYCDLKGLVHIYKRNRPADAPVRLLKLDNIYEEYQGARIFDIKRYFHLDISQCNENCIFVTKNEVINKYYSLFLELSHLQNQEVKIGQKEVKLSDLFVAPYALPPARSTCRKYVNKQLLSTDISEIILHSNQYEDEPPFDMDGNVYAPPGKFLLETKDLLYPAAYGLHTSDDPFITDYYIDVFRINEHHVLPEYLIYILKQYETVLIPYPSIRLCMTMPVVIDDIEKQEQIVKTLKSQLQGKLEEELEAELKRIGINQSITDLVHMLGTPKHKIEQIIRRLERIKPDADNYDTTIRALRDNIDYMDRLIEYDCALKDQCNIPEQPEDFSQFIRAYAERWRNYGIKCFELSINDQLGDDAQLRFDGTRISVMLDAILGNAARHGFHKQLQPGNLVEIKLSKKIYNNEHYIRLTVSNNGDPMPENFTFDDYVSRRHYSAETGRSGLGGYQVFQVVMGHHGCMRLDSNDQWNMIVDILLPLEATQNI